MDTIERRAAAGACSRLVDLEDRDKSWFRERVADPEWSGGRRRRSGRLVSRNSREWVQRDTKLHRTKSLLPETAHKYVCLCTDPRRRNRILLPVQFFLLRIRTAGFTHDGCPDPQGPDGSAAIITLSRARTLYEIDAPATWVALSRKKKKKKNVPVETDQRVRYPFVSYAVITVITRSCARSLSCPRVHEKSARERNQNRRTSRRPAHENRRTRLKIARDSGPENEKYEQKTAKKPPGREWRVGYRTRATVCLQ